MDKQTLKNKLNQQAKQIGWRVITTVILTLTAVVTVWVYAAFVEPSVSPSSSDQDFSQNILGANDSNNEFSSSNITSNADGSIIERQEYIQTGIGTTTDASSMSTTLFAGQQYIADNMDPSVSARMISAISASTYTLSSAVNYCQDLSAACAYTVDESTCPAGTFTGWRLPTVEELSLFLLNPSGSEGFTRTKFTVGSYMASSCITLNLTTGVWATIQYDASEHVYCIR